MSNAEENKRWIRQKFREKYGDAEASRIEQQAQLIFLKRYAPDELIRQRFNNMMKEAGYAKDYGAADAE